MRLMRLMGVMVWLVGVVGAMGQPMTFQDQACLGVVINVRVLPSQVTWAPTYSSLNWIDKVGGYSGVLAAFWAQADMASVTNFGKTYSGLTSIYMLDGIPAVIQLQLSHAELTALDITGCTNLQFVFAQYNKLTSSIVNGILQRLSVGGLSNGIVDVHAQSPSAAPSGAGLTARTNLVSRGWTVTTD